MSPTSGPAGTPVTIHLKGVGWTDFDNIYVATYDNGYMGYACGFNSQGDVVVNFTATGSPGMHLIDFYPGIYQGPDGRPAALSPAAAHVRGRSSGQPHSGAAICVRGDACPRSLINGVRPRFSAGPAAEAEHGQMVSAAGPAQASPLQGYWEELQSRPSLRPQRSRCCPAPSPRHSEDRTRSR